MKKEIRKSKRVPFKQRIKFGIQKPEDYGACYDLSDHGLGIFTEKAVDVGTTLKIEIQLGDMSIKTEGEVVWTFQDTILGHYRSGIKLTVYPEMLRGIHKKALQTLKQKAS
ncbi:MAG: PilZ domain-containing protein [Thermodesulfobacteriota bacterium]